VRVLPIVDGNGVTTFSLQPKFLLIWTASASMLLLEFENATMEMDKYTVRMSRMLGVDVN
jgi:hypothetical protein